VKHTRYEAIPCIWLVLGHTLHCGILDEAYKRLYTL